MIAVAIILAFGHVNGLFFIEKYGEEELNANYLWPVFVYFAVAGIIWIAKLVINEGSKENGAIETTSEKTGKT